MCNGLFSRNHAAEFRVDLKHGLAKEETAKVSWIILTILRGAAQAEIHYPAMPRLSDEVIHNFRRENYLLRVTDWFVHLDDTILWQVDDVIPLEQRAVGSLP
jgi:hypothetical protein